VVHIVVCMCNPHVFYVCVIMVFVVRMCCCIHPKVCFLHDRVT
jgi:hypothetical protein